VEYALAVVHASPVVGLALGAEVSLAVGVEQVVLGEHHAHPPTISAPRCAPDRRMSRTCANLATSLVPRYDFKLNAMRDAYEVDKEKMVVVRHIFCMVGVEGASIHAIKHAFEREGVPRRAGANAGIGPSSRPELPTAG
jgi:hypothetical protein